MATTYTLQAAEVGKIINLTQPTGGISFTGSTCYLLVTNPAGVETSYTCSVTSTYAYYTTTGSEFPTAGTYSIQLKYTNGGEKYFGPVTSLKVLPNLGS